MNINEITGDVMVTKPSTTAYDEGWERIFGKKGEQLELPLNVPKNNCRQPTLCKFPDCGCPVEVLK